MGPSKESLSSKKKVSSAQIAFSVFQKLVLFCILFLFLLLLLLVVVVVLLLLVVVVVVVVVIPVSLTLSFRAAGLC
jgi:hypothetical protein